MAHIQYPLLPGQRVILDPECDGYEEKASFNNHDAGYVVFPGHGDDTLCGAWVSAGEETKGNINVKVLWDNGKTNSYRTRDLIVVSTKEEDVIRFRLNVTTVYQVKEMQSDDLDLMIINDGEPIVSETLYNQERRDHVRNKIDKARRN